MRREQTEQGRILATQDDHASMFRALGSIRLKASELHSSVRRLLIVACEQHNEVARVLNGLVHLLDKVRSKGNVVVLNEDLVALLRKNVGYLLRNSGHRAATAQEEIVTLSGTAWHGSDPRLQRRWSRAHGGPSRTAGSRGEINFQTQPALAPAWHGPEDLRSALVAAVIQVNELAARERSALAHCHGRLALGAQERMSG